MFRRWRERRLHSSLPSNFLFVTKRSDLLLVTTNNTVLPVFMMDRTWRKGNHHVLISDVDNAEVASLLKSRTRGAGECKMSRWEKICMDLHSVQTVCNCKVTQAPFTRYHKKPCRASSFLGVLSWRLSSEEEQSSRKTNALSLL